MLCIITTLKQNKQKQMQQKQMQQKHMQQKHMHQYKQQRNCNHYHKDIIV